MEVDQSTSAAAVELSDKKAATLIDFSSTTRKITFFKTFFIYSSHYYYSCILSVRGSNIVISFSKDMPDGKGLSEEKIQARNTKKFVLSLDSPYNGGGQFPLTRIFRINHYDSFRQTFQLISITSGIFP
jgi:hypothetical protein